MADPRDRFIIHRLRAKPITYSVEITHLVIQDEWNLSIKVSDVSMETDDERSRIAEDLRAAADLIERRPMDASAATFLGYRDADGNEMHCSREKCDECGVCKNPVARPGTQKRDTGNVVPPWAETH